MAPTSSASMVGRGGHVNSPGLRAFSAAIVGYIGFQFLLIGTIAAAASVALSLDGHREAIILPPIGGFLVYVGIEGLRTLSRLMRAPPYR